MTSQGGRSSPRPPDEGPAGQDRLRVYFDADVLFAGATSPSEHSASQVLLVLSESTLIDGRTSELAVEECRRNLEGKLPAAIGDFERLIGRALSVVDAPSRDELLSHTDRADWKDLPHLVSALDQDCSHLATYSLGDYEPGHPEVEVLRPGALVRRVRERLSSL